METALLNNASDFTSLEDKLAGELFYNDSSAHQAQLLAYSTDASIYQEKPVAVALPANEVDIKHLVVFATANKLTLIPRAAGTSLAGQVVGDGIVVDISKHFNQIIEVNAVEKWVKVQPGVIRDDLNQYLKPFGLMFGPETSTANRAMIGGMIGNNSCGLHSIVWGSVRDHLLELKVVLSDGTSAVFNKDAVANDESQFKGEIEASVMNLLADPATQKLVRDNFPKASVVRRNSGYAIDALINNQPFDPSGQTFNLCRLLAGSEGTLAFVTEAKLNLIDLPPAQVAVLCVHTTTIDEALRANLIALKHQPYASELVDKYICDFTIGHPEYGQNRFFIEGDPAAILMVEFMEDELDMAVAKAEKLAAELVTAGLGYAYPILKNQQTKAAWDIRKAGLGLLRNLKGKAQPVNLIEDCAVAPEDLPDYIADLGLLLDRHNVKASYYAHAGAGELHVEPMIDLKSAEGVKLFRDILTETAALVKKYRGSLSGEHGDGRLRGEHITQVMGQETYELFKQVKQIFDPYGIFNRGKITGVPQMDTSLRVKIGQAPSRIDTIFDFSDTNGILGMAEKCSGSGDCRKSAISGGVMCPSYMATRQEKDTTRARANVLRQFLSNEHDMHPLDHPEIKEVLDLCLSCKGCKTECPSGVDVGKMKAVYLQHSYDRHGIPLRTRLIAGFSSQMKLASAFPAMYNLIFQSGPIRRIINKMIGFYPDRSMPKLASQTLLKWFRQRTDIQTSTRKVYLFCDEFTNYNDAEVGKKAILLLEALGYQIVIPDHFESGRTWLSKGLIRQAKTIAEQNTYVFAGLVTADTPLIGIEPSAILTFRDEYIDLTEGDTKAKARAIAAHTFTIEEFLSREAKLNRIDRELFTREEKNVKIHGHCYQKALSSQAHLQAALSIPLNYQTFLIPSGCCGMAGSFGYEKEHYEVSQQIGELVLFKAVRDKSAGEIICASGTSCRHQIKDATDYEAQHPVEVLWDALLQNARPKG